MKRVTRWNLIAQLTAAQPTNKKGYTGGGGWKLRNENESFPLCLACLYWTTRPFFVQIPNRIKWQSNSFLDIQYLPSVLRNENWKCLLHERREIFLGLLLNSHPHGFYRIQTTRNKKMSSKKCQISILKRTLKSWFRVLIFHTHRSALSGSNVFCENFLWRVDEKMGSEQSCRSITLQKIRIGLNQRRKYVDKVIMALTMYDTFYNVN